MGLIDADKLKKELYQKWFMDILLTQRNSEDMFYALVQKIDEQPTAYDVDAVVERLEKKAIPVEDEDEHVMPESNIHETYEIKMVALSDAIEIVKAGGIDGN